MITFFKAPLVWSLFLNLSNKGLLNMNLKYSFPDRWKTYILKLGQAYFKKYKKSVILKLLYFLIQNNLYVLSINNCSAEYENS